MENQHRKIKGYRELTQEEIDLMNTIKERSQSPEAKKESDIVDRSIECMGCQ